MNTPEGHHAEAGALWNGLDEETLWRVEREYCAPQRRGQKPGGDALAFSLGRCGEILLEPLYQNEVKSRADDLDDAAFGRATGFGDGATFSRFRRGMYSGQLGQGRAGWSRARRLLRAMLLGTGVELSAELDATDSRQAIARRMENYFFGTDDTGPFFAEAAMYSPAPSRESEAAYEMLWLADEARKNDAEGELYVASGGQTLAPSRRNSIGPRAILAAAAAGIKCVCFYPHPDDFGDTQAREDYRRFVEGMQRLWGDPQCQGYVRSISPALAGQPAPVQNFHEVPVRPCWRSEDGKLWGAQFLQPNFRYVYLNAPGVMHEPCFMVLRAPDSVPFCWVGGMKEAEGFGKWVQMVLARHSEASPGGSVKSTRTARNGRSERGGRARGTT